jgi:GxxExxY protein
MTLLYADLTSKILNACFEVSNELSAGFLESVYQNSLVIALKQKGLRVASHYPLSVHFRGEAVGQYFADILVEDIATVELRTVSTLLPEHQAQVINYLKAVEIEVGLLINFGRPKLEYKRLERNKTKPAQ